MRISHTRLGKNLQILKAEDKVIHFRDIQAGESSIVEASTLMGKSSISEVSKQIGITLHLLWAKYQKYQGRWGHRLSPRHLSR